MECSSQVPACHARSEGHTSRKAETHCGRDGWIVWLDASTGSGEGLEVRLVVTPWGMGFS